MEEEGKCQWEAKADQLGRMLAVFGSRCSGINTRARYLWTPYRSMYNYTCSYISGNSSRPEPRGLIKLQGMCNYSLVVVQRVTLSPWGSRLLFACRVDVGRAAVTLPIKAACFVHRRSSSASSSSSRVLEMFGCDQACASWCSGPVAVRI